MTKQNPFALLCTAGLFAIFSSTISKSPALPLFAAHLGAGPSGVGMVASVSALTGILASIPAGILADRFGRRRLLAVSGFVFATAPLLYLVVENIWQLALVRFYHGFATAIFIPVAMAFVAGLHETGRGEKIGWFSTSTLLGRFAAPVAGGAVIGAYVYAPALGFRGVYILCGIAGLIALALLLRLPAEDTGQAGPHDWSRAFAEFRAAASNRLILVTAAAEASILFAYGTFETFLPLHALKEGHSAYIVGLLLSSQVITLALTKPVMGRFSDRHGRKPQIIAGTLAGALCLLGFSVSIGLLPLLSLSVMFGLCISVVTSATSAYIADLSRKEGLGSSMGILGSVMDIGHTTGPLAAGFIAAAFGFGAAFMGAAAVLGLACASFTVVMATSPNVAGFPLSRE
ncbi:MAG: MFS transporter [Nitrospirae bacterium]|nr:MFS transporter [Nitrospirota bacterium]